MRKTLDFTLTGKALSAFFLVSVCLALPTRPGPHATGFSYEQTLVNFSPGSLSYEQRELLTTHNSLIETMDRRDTSAPAITTDDLHSLYEMMLSIESALTTSSSSATLPPSIVTSELPTVGTSSEGSADPRTTTNFSTNPDDMDDNRPDGLLVAAWLMGSIFAFVLCISLCRLLVTSRQSKNGRHYSVSWVAAAKPNEPKVAKEKHVEMKVIDIKKECLVSRFSDYSSECSSFTADSDVESVLGQSARIPVSQLYTKPKSRIPSSLLRPASLFSSLRSASSIMRKTHQHIRTSSAPERRYKSTSFLGHPKSAKSMTDSEWDVSQDMRTPKVVSTPKSVL